MIYVLALFFPGLVRHKVERCYNMELYLRIFVVNLICRLSVSCNLCSSIISVFNICDF